MSGSFDPNPRCSRFWASTVAMLSLPAMRPKWERVLRQHVDW